MEFAKFFEFDTQTVAKGAFGTQLFEECFGLLEIFSRDVLASE